MKKRKRSFFTLLELLVSMGVFAVLMLALMQFFTSAQNIWSNSNSKTEMFDDARLALNIMATDLQCMYYEDMHDNKKAFFVFSGQSDAEKTVSVVPSGTATGYTGFAFAVLRPSKASSKAITRITEVFYRLNTENHTLEMKIVSDREAYDDDGKWCTIPASSSITAVDGTAFAKLDENVNKETTPDGWNVLLSDVRDFVVICRDRQWNVITKTRLYASADAAKVPYMVELRLTMTDPEVLAPIKARHGGTLPKDSDLTTEEKELLKATQQEFVRAVIIDRGQY